MPLEACAILNSKLLPAGSGSLPECGKDILIEVVNHDCFDWLTLSDLFGFRGLSSRHNVSSASDGLLHHAVR